MLKIFSLWLLHKHFSSVQSVLELIPWLCILSLVKNILTSERPFRTSLASNTYLSFSVPNIEARYSAIIESLAHFQADAPMFSNIQKQIIPMLYSFKNAPNAKAGYNLVGLVGNSRKRIFWKWILKTQNPKEPEKRKFASISIFRDFFFCFKTNTKLSWRS